MGAYSKLNEYLHAQRASEIGMTFAQLERVLGRRLPPSALRYSAWWANNSSGHSHSRAWLDVGWRTERVDIDGRQLVFKRTRSPASGSPFGALRGTVLNKRDIVAPTGETWRADEGNL